MTNPWLLYCNAINLLNFGVLLFWLKGEILLCKGKDFSRSFERTGNSKHQ